MNFRDVKFTFLGIVLTAGFFAVLLHRDEITDSKTYSKPCDLEQEKHQEGRKDLTENFSSESDGLKTSDDGYNDPQGLTTNAARTLSSERDMAGNYLEPIPNSNLSWYAIKLAFNTENELQVWVEPNNYLSDVQEGIDSAIHVEVDFSVGSVKVFPFAGELDFVPDNICQNMDQDDSAITFGIHQNHAELKVGATVMLYSSESCAGIPQILTYLSVRPDGL